MCDQGWLQSGALRRSWFLAVIRDLAEPLLFSRVSVFAVDGAAIRISGFALSMIFVCGTQCGLVALRSSLMMIPDDWFLLGSCFDLWCYMASFVVFWCSTGFCGGMI